VESQLLFKEGLHGFMEGKLFCFVVLCCSFLIMLIKLLTTRDRHYLCHVDLIDIPIQFYRTPRESISAFSELIDILVNYMYFNLYILGYGKGYRE